MGKNNDAPRPSDEISNIILKNGGYGNFVFYVMFLLQQRVKALFEGEDFNDKNFAHFFLKLHDMLLKIEQKIETPLIFSEALADLV